MAAMRQAGRQSKPALRAGLAVALAALPVALCGALSATRPNQRGSRTLRQLNPPPCTHPELLDVPGCLGQRKLHLAFLDLRLGGCAAGGLNSRLATSYQIGGVTPRPP